MKFRDIKDLSDEQLEDQLRDLCQQMFKTRFRAATEKLESPAQVRLMRRDIARIKTLQSQRRIAAEKIAGEKKVGELAK